MKPYYIFDDASGQILFTGITIEEKETDEGMSFRFHHEKVDSVEYYHNIESDQLEVRPLMPCTVSDFSILADGNSACTISNLPNPVTVKWPDGVITEVTDGEIIFKVDMAGNYAFELDAFPYKTHFLLITAG